ncbi:MAG: thymidine kinase [Brumimicrobium sp.]|nr:thymidine kinase [Brumimicrobium sp.]
MFLEQFPEHSTQRGWIEVVCGSMFSGKTEELIRRLRRVEYAGLPLLLVKPIVDNRYSKEKVVSHSGHSLESIQVAKAEDILSHWKGERIVGIDETQFFGNEIVDVANQLAGWGVRVICAGLDMDFTGKPFGPIPLLMANAEYVTKVHAICVSCGNLAQYSHRKTKHTEQVLVGATSEYEPLCRLCYNKYKQ